MSEAGRYRFIDGKLVKISDRPRLPSHYGGEDRMDPIMNPVNGKIYDSKSMYHQAVKDAGCIIMGDDAPVKPSTPQTKDIDWKAAVAETLNTTS